MLSMQEMSDRMEIQELMVRYSHAVDTRDWDAYETVFTADARIDYSEMGGAAGNVAEVRAFLEQAMPRFAGFQPMVANTVLDFVDDNTVHSRTICHNPMVLDKGDGQTHVFYCGLWYRDVVVRTADGWRIKDRYEEKCYMHNVPTDLLG
jgi:3-phenylpropionate/cinnamic acid dioxygenase small subunit